MNATLKMKLINWFENRSLSNWLRIVCFFLFIWEEKKQTTDINFGSIIQNPSKSLQIFKSFKFDRLNVFATESLYFSNYSEF